MSDIAGILSDTIPDYEYLLYLSKSSIRFLGKTLDEWTQELDFTTSVADASIDQLESLNEDFIRQNEIVMKNLSCSKAAYDLAKIDYTVSSMAFKDSERSKRKNAGERMPSLDMLDIMAKNNCIKKYNSYKVSEIFLDFWKLMHDKLKLVDNRLTGMNILKNVESRYAFKS